MAFALVLALLIAAPPEEAADCAERCERTVSVFGFSRLCERCVSTRGEARGDWVEAIKQARPFPEPLPALALGDDDWAVRWGAIRLIAARKLRTPSSQLAEQIASARSNRVLPLALTAAHVAGAHHQPTAKLLSSAGAFGGRAASKVWQLREPIRQAMELELYRPPGFLAREALDHLATFRSVSAVRAALDALASRPADSDAVIAGVLRAELEAHQARLVPALEKEAKRGGVDQVNRLLTVYSAQLEQLRRKAGVGSSAERTRTIAELATFWPLSESDLDADLGDANRDVRRAAALAISEAEGRPFPACVSTRIASWLAQTTPDPQVLRWVRALGETGHAQCGEPLSAIGRNSRFSNEVRASAYRALGQCAPTGLFRWADDGLAASSPLIRAEAMRALAGGAWDPDVRRAVTRALADPEPEVLAAAAEVEGRLSVTAFDPRLIPLLDHRDGRVRLAAMEAIAHGAPPAQTKEIAERLTTDSLPKVRAAAARALGQAGGPSALAALSTAAKTDPDESVRRQAQDALSLLGFGAPVRTDNRASDRTR